MSIKVILYSYLHLRRGIEHVTWFPDYRLAIEGSGDWEILGPDQFPRYISVAPGTTEISKNYVQELLIPDENHLSTLLKLFVSHGEQMVKMRKVIKDVADQLHDGKTTNLVQMKSGETVSTSVLDEKMVQQSAPTTTVSDGMASWCTIS